MKTEFEADLSEAFAARAAAVPVAAALPPPVHGLPATGAPAPCAGGGRRRGAGQRRHRRRRAVRGARGSGARLRRLESRRRRLRTSSPSPSAAASCQSQLTTTPPGPGRSSLGSGTMGERAHRRAGALHRRPVPERRSVRRLLHQLFVHRAQHGLVRRLLGSSGGFGDRLGFARCLDTRRERRQAGRHRFRRHVQACSVGGGTASGDLSQVSQSHLSTQRRARTRSLTVASQRASPVSRWSSTTVRTS